MDGRTRLLESWARTTAHLDGAAGLLPAAPVESEEGGRMASYREWMHHNELELALGELEELGELNLVPREFWGHLAAAAREMKLERHALRIDLKLAENAG